MRSVAWVGCLVAGVVALPGSAAAQETSLKDALYGRSAPLTLKLKDLTPEWRRISVSGGPEAGGGLSGLMGGIMGAMFGGGGAPKPSSSVYYTKGDTVTIGGETYLVMYRQPAKGMDMAALMQAGPGALPPPEKLSPESPLALYLLNARTIVGIGEIRAFDMAVEIAESEKAAQAEAALGEALKAGPGALGGPGAAIVEPALDVVAKPEPTPAPKKAAPAPKKPAPAPKKK
jgi:hypothetical protein